MRQFSEEDQVEKEFKTDYLPFGVSKVKLVLFEHGGAEEGEKEYIEVSVCDPNDEDINESARFWFTTDQSTNIALNTIKDIAALNAGEKDAAAARQAIKDCKNGAELADLLNTKLIGGDAWFTKYYDPKRTYVKDGVTKKSVNKNVIGYEAKEKPELMQAEKKLEEPFHEGDHMKAVDEPASKVPKKW